MTTLITPSGFKTFKTGNPTPIEERLHYREQYEQGSAGPGYITGLKELYRHLFPFPVGPVEVVELGTWTGNSAFAWLSEGAMLWSIDNNQDNSSSLVEDTRRYGWTQQLRLIQSDSIEEAKKWDFPIDLLYIDTDHTYDRTLMELIAWTPHVKPGGYVVLDDATGYPDVRKAFDSYAETHDMFQSSTFYPGPTYTPASHGLIVARVK